MSNDEWQTPDALFNVLDKGGVWDGIEFEGFNFDIDLCATAENSKCERFYQDYLTNRIHLKGDHSGDATGYWWSLAGHNNPLSCHKLNCAFMNPPYSRTTKDNPGIAAFIEKAWEDSKRCKIVCLVPAMPSTKWWATFWEYGSFNDKCVLCKGRGHYQLISESGRITDPMFCECYYNGSKPGCEVLFFPKRIKFEAPWRTVYNCNYCRGIGLIPENGRLGYSCKKCNETGIKKLSGPAFGCALVIMDRRNT